MADRARCSMWGVCFIFLVCNLNGSYELVAVWSIFPNVLTREALLGFGSTTLSAIKMARGLLGGGCGLRCDCGFSPTGLLTGRLDTHSFHICGLGRDFRCGDSGLQVQAIRSIFPYILAGESALQVFRTLFESIRRRS